MTHHVTTVRAMYHHQARQQDAYAEGWAAAEAWHAGDDDARTEPPRGTPAAQAKAWIRGFTDSENLIEGADDV